MKSQDNREGLRVLPLKAMECGKNRKVPLPLPVLQVAKRAEGRGKCRIQPPGEPPVDEGADKDNRAKNEAAGKQHCQDKAKRQR